MNYNIQIKWVNNDFKRQFIVKLKNTNMTIFKKYFYYLANVDIDLY